MKLEDIDDNMLYGITYPANSKTQIESAEVLPLKQYADAAPENINLGVLQSNLANCLGIIDNEVMKGYVTRLDQLPILSADQYLQTSNLDGIQFFQISELVYQEDEFAVDKLAMVFQSLSNQPCTLALMLRSDGERTEFYMGARPTDGNSAGALRQMLEKTLIGFFPGSCTKPYRESTMKTNLKDLNIQCISSVTCIADYKQNEELMSNKGFIQGLEKFVYTMQGEVYTAIFIADHVEHNELMQRKNEYEQIFTQISPFANIQMNFSVTDGGSESVGNSTGETTSIAKSEAKGSSKSITSTLTKTEGMSETTGMTDSHSKSQSFSKSVAEGNTHTTGITDGTSTTVTDGVSVGAFAGIKGVGVTGGYSHSVSKGVSHTDSVSDSVMKTLTHGLSDSQGQSHSDSNSKGISESTSTSFSVGTGTNESVSDTFSKAFNLVNTTMMTNTFGTSKGITLNAQNKVLGVELQKLEKHLERIGECESCGMWNFAAYFLAESKANAERAANTYKAVIVGTDSGIERSAINTWTDEEQIRELSKYVKNFVHPRFIYQGFSYDGQRLISVDPAVLVSTKELAIHMGLPRHSVVGLPVVEHIGFAQEVLTENKGYIEQDEKIAMGNIYNLGQVAKTEIKLDLKSLAMHTFVTGSTGSGKSNTVYNLLWSLRNNRVKFLVVEPAKGEYKNVFGHLNDVRVLGTNPQYTDLLRINPFRFPKGIHVLEHIDRLVEIFNVCWPMYAAMPAVLKDAILQAYESCGWDLVESTNRYNKELFPTFADLLNELVDVIKHSDYSDEVKSNYTGSLVTRIRSLTNGLNGQIFAANEVDNRDLFDKNVIVDISRVGSSETKSLIMGILVMRLSEHRMSSCTDMNVPLQHVTVLEEAHNILKRTSTEQNPEGSNVAGKSVEMISNAIAEMRTYGEGFIIADQSPSAVDISAIRNTNTKIIMRLPDEQDRRLAGKSAGLKDNQLDEIAKLPKGVAVVYQNDWLEPVLCKINKYGGKDWKETPYRKKQEHEPNFVAEKTKMLLRNLLKKSSGERLDMNLDELTSMLIGMDIPSKTKIAALKAFRVNGECPVNDISSVIYDLICTPAVEKEAETAESIEEWKNTFLCSNQLSLTELDEESQNKVVECVLREQIERYNKPEEYLDTWNKYLQGEVM